MIPYSCVTDIIFLRGWYSIHPRQFYNPVTSLLLSDKSKWSCMRLTGQARRDEVKTSVDINSTYKKIERPARRFNPLLVPKKLQAQLPYASKPKLMKTQKTPTYLQKRAVVMEPEEERALAMMRALRKDKIGKKRRQRRSWRRQRNWRKKRMRRRAKRERRGRKR